VLKSKTTAGQRRLLPGAIKAAREEINRIEAEGFVGREDRVYIRDLFEDWYFPNEPFIRKGYLILGAEAAFNLKLTDEASYTFIVDLIVKTPQGEIVAVDHKNQYDFINEGDARLLPQLPKYIGALRALGTPVEYGLYNQLRTRKVSGPAMKKAEIVDAIMAKSKPGERSRVETAKLTVAALQAIADEKGITTKTGPALEQMLTQTPVKPTDARVIRTFDDQLEVALFLIDRDDEEPLEDIDAAAWRVGNKNVCGYCEYKTLCSAELEDRGVEDAMEFYTKKEAREGVPLTSDDIED
jgi:hypothetical protein